MTPDTLELQSIAQRLRKLEEQNQKLRWGGMIVLVTLSAIVLMGQGAPASRVLEAEKFVLKDASGNVRGWMGVVGNGSELMLGNSNAQPMLRLLVSTDASDLHFFGSRQSGISLGVDSAEPAFSMVDAEGRGRVRITFANDGPGLTLRDGRGFSTAIGLVELTNHAKHPARLASAASVMLLDKNEAIIWRAP